MTKEIMQSEDNVNSVIVNVGENQAVSMQVVQDIYNEITGKSENLSRIFRANHKATSEDLKQLNTKIEQLYEQYNIISKNCAISVYHIDDCKEQFSSFERFSLGFDSSSMSPIENIRLEYNFLIILPKTKRAQSYKLLVDMHSRVALKLKAESEHGLPRRVIRIFGTRTASVEIDYIDYTVARNFMVAIDQWFSALPKNPSSNIVEKLQDQSEHFSFMFRISTAIFIIWYLLANKVKFLGNEPTLNQLFTTSAIGFGAVFILSIFAGKLGQLCDRGIESYQPISYLQLNRGDTDAVQKFKKCNRNSIIKFLSTIAVAILVNLASTWLASYIGIGT
jgi:hypothetical protein